jgi:hypothetical protein
MVAPPPSSRSPEAMPRVVAIAVALWVLGAVLRTVPLSALLPATPIGGATWYFERHYPGWSLVLPLQVFLLVFLLLGHAWARYAVALLVAGLLLAHTSEGFRPQFGNFPLGALRSVAIAALELSTVVLLFLPSARGWFRRRSAA